MAWVWPGQTGALTAQVSTLDEMISELIAQIPAAQGAGANGTTGPGAGRGPDAAVLPAAARLDEITGCGITAAQAIIAEIGPGMTVFGTPGRLVSWAKRCPQTRQSGKKSTAGSAGKGNPWLNGVLGEIAAAAAARTDTFPGERYRRLARRRRKRKALAAIARSVLVIIFHLLADPAARPAPPAAPLATALKDRV